MAVKIEWAPTAKLDFRDLLLFIAEDKPIVAKEFRAKILQHVNQLNTFPNSGRIVPEFNDESLREIIESP